MDLRRMALIDTPTANVSSAGMDAYKLGEDKLNMLCSLLPNLCEMEYWDPVFQAWKPFIDRYLSSGANPALTTKYYAVLLQKEDNLVAKPAAYSNIFAEILKMRNTSGTLIFDGYFYGDIFAFCENQCKFFVSTQQTLSKQLYSRELYVQTLDDLLKIGTWRALMCALILYRHCQIENFNWPATELLSLQDKLGEWLEKFLKAFDDASAFVGAGHRVYTWYQPTVQEVIRRTWSSALLLVNRPLVITRDDVYAVDSEVATQLVKYVNMSPAVYDDPFDEQTVWDSMSALFNAPNPSDPLLAESAYKALCVPRSYFKKMCNILYDFYWIVKDLQLTSQMYARKQVEWSSNPDSDKTPEEYLEDLYNHGFPSVQERRD